MLHWEWWGYKLNQNVVSYLLLTVDVVVVITNAAAVRISIQIRSIVIALYLWKEEKKQNKAN